MKLPFTVIATIFSGVVFFAGCAADPINLGKEAAQKGDYQAAINYWLPEAKRGNPKAVFNLALMAENGAGMPQDRQLAINLFTLAAQSGLPEARFELARLGAPVPEIKLTSPTQLPYIIQNQPQQNLQICEFRYQQCLNRARDVYQRNACQMESAGCAIGNALGNALTR